MTAEEMEMRDAGVGLTSKEIEMREAGVGLGDVLLYESSENIKLLPG